MNIEHVRSDSLLKESAYCLVMLGVLFHRKKKITPKASPSWTGSLIHHTQCLLRGNAIILRIPKGSCKCRMVKDRAGSKNTPSINSGSKSEETIVA